MIHQLAALRNMELNRKIASSSQTSLGSVTPLRRKAGYHDEEDDEIMETRKVIANLNLRDSSEEASSM